MQTVKTSFQSNVTVRQQLLDCQPPNMGGTRVITDRNSMQYRVWFMHGTSHYLGMNVHDVGLPVVKLEAGMVFTVEPGIYIRPDALDYLPKTPENEKFIAAVRSAFEKYKGIGVRIEGDVVVTPDGYRSLSAALPRAIPDIESFIVRAQREVRQARGASQASFDLPIFSARYQEK